MNAISNHQIHAWYRYVQQRYNFPNWEDSEDVVHRAVVGGMTTWPPHHESLEKWIFSCIHYKALDKWRYNEAHYGDRFEPLFKDDEDGVVEHRGISSPSSPIEDLHQKDMQWIFKEAMRRERNATPVKGWQKRYMSEEQAMECMMVPCESGNVWKKYRSTGTTSHRLPRMIQEEAQEVADRWGVGRKALAATRRRYLLEVKKLVEEMGGIHEVL